jgi:diguanylate cyclase (GGDEF)-like protein
VKESASCSLSSIEILSSLSPEELSSLYARMTREEYAAGEPLFRESEAGEVMYIVLSGAVSISVRSPDGEMIEIAQITEGNFFGEMSIFDSTPRSATCIPLCNTSVLSLKAEDFFLFIKEMPEAGIRVMHRMLGTITTRLRNTDAFLADMVTWGEKARTRAITDDFTGLYNRRFLDTAMENSFFEAEHKGEPLSVVMLDLDHFGTLNNEYGQAAGDTIILEAVRAFRKIFSRKEILARYGGDEFIFLLPGTTGEKAEELCRELLEKLRKIKVPDRSEGSIKMITASIGIASFPAHGNTAPLIRECSDKALYKAKEKGRDTVVLWTEQGKESGEDDG